MVDFRVQVGYRVQGRFKGLWRVGCFQLIGRFGFGLCESETGRVGGYRVRRVYDNPGLLTTNRPGKMSELMMAIKDGPRCSWFGAFAPYSSKKITIDGIEKILFAPISKQQAKQLTKMSSHSLSFCLIGLQLGFNSSLFLFQVQLTSSHNQPFIYSFTTFVFIFVMTTVFIF